jgi:glycosyltransferase involved in cell wall biosynthesis
MNSIINQSYKPKKIIVVNDGSSDKTGEILDSYKEKFPELVSIIHTDSKTRDYARIPTLWNMCLRKEYDFHMIGAGDIIYEKDYALKLLKKLNENSNLMVCSGDYFPFKAKVPHGAGRFVRQSFFFENYNKYFEIMGYESEILFRAYCNGNEAKIFNDIIFEHKEELGHGHNFEEFGRGMKSLGYHPLYVLGRFFIELFNNDGIKTRGVFNMIWKYFSYRPKKTGYFSLFPEKIRKDIREYQKKQIIKKFKKSILFY